MFEEKNSQCTPLERLGKFGLVKHLTQQIDIANPTTIKAIGDDAAVLKFFDK